MPADTNRTPEPAGDDFGPFCVLHVDDSLADRHRRRRALERAGVRVLDAVSGRAAIDMLASAPVDLALLDVNLPDGSGFDLARRIKQLAHEEDRDIAVVLISAYFTDSGARVYGLESGADAYLAEPVEDAELVATVRAVGRVLRQLRVAREQQRMLDALLEYVPEGIAVASGPEARIVRTSRYVTAVSGREWSSGAAETAHPGADWDDVRLPR